MKFSTPRMWTDDASLPLLTAMIQQYDRSWTSDESHRNEVLQIQESLKNYIEIRFRGEALPSREVKAEKRIEIPDEGSGRQMVLRKSP